MNQPELQPDPKEGLLNKPVEHVDITEFDARPIIDSMEKMFVAKR